jgi:hypothetical protein
MNWLARILNMPWSQRGGEDTVAAEDAEDCGLDTALRHTIRGEVAGATPRSDAWMRLHQRIQQDAPGPAWLYQQAPHVPVQPVWPRRDPFSAVFLTRFTQLGAALMMLLLMLGNLHTLDQVGALAPTPVALQSASDDTAPPAQTTAHTNRALQILSDPSPTATPIVSTAVVAPRLAIKIKQAAQAAPDVATVAAAPAPVLRPDGGEWLHDPGAVSVEAPGGAEGDGSGPAHTAAPNALVPR